MKKLSLYAILVLIMWVFFVSYQVYEGKLAAATQKAKLAISNFGSVKSYLLKHYKGNYPVPSWDLILLDKTKKMIHLVNRNTPLNKIKNLYAIQWTTCDILKNDKKFDKINYDPRFSIINKKTKKVLFKRCFTYSVTKDRKHFQIWTLYKKKWWDYVARLDSDVKMKSMTKSYNFPILVENWSNNFLPYASMKLSPMVEVKNIWNFKVTVNVSWDTNDREFLLKKWLNKILTWDISWKYNISITWKVGKNTQIKFIWIDGSIIYIRWDKQTWKVNFALKDYSVNWDKLNYFVETWRFIASIIRLWPDKNMSVNHDWTTLVIRWTKFTIDANKTTFDTFLSLWHIVQKIWDQSVDLTMQRWFSLLKNNKFVKDVEKIKQLVWFTLYSNILNQNVWGPNIYGTSNNLTGILKNFPMISYDDWQKFSVIKLTPKQFSNNAKKMYKINSKKKKNEWIKECNWKTWCITLKQFENRDNSDMCKYYHLWHTIDTTKLYYVLKNDWLKNFKNSHDKRYLRYTFNLDKTIKNRLKIKKDDIIITSRKPSVVSKWKIGNGYIESQRIDYKMINNTLDTLTLQNLILYPNNYPNTNNIVILCDNE